MTKTAEPWRVLQGAADRNLARFRDTYTRSIERLRRLVSDDVAERAVAAGGLTAELVALVDGVVIAKETDPAALAGRAYEETIVATVLDLGDYITRYGAPAAALAGSFTINSPWVIIAAERMAANLVREVGDETKRAIREVIVRAVRDGIPPREAARLLRGVVGLTRAQSLAVLNHQAGLAASGVSPSRAARLVRAYEDRLLRDRALSIARTETMRASNRGQQLLWEEMISRRIIDGATFRQKWSTTPDDRTCPRCLPMDGKVIAIGGSWTETERGGPGQARAPVAGVTVRSPPLHPRCRCVAVADVDPV